MHFSFFNNWCISILGLIIVEVWGKYNYPQNIKWLFQRARVINWCFNFGGASWWDKTFSRKTMTELGGVSFFNSLTCCWEQPNKALASPSNLRNDPKDSESLGLEIPQHPYPSGVVQLTRPFQALRSLYDVKSGLMGHRKKNQESPVGSTETKTKI